MGPLRQTLALAFAVLACLSASYLWQIQDRLGPHRQYINVRFAADVSSDARREFERLRGLASGEDKGTRTWTYQLTDQSTANIRALLQSPLVEDTFHLDPVRLRVQLDLPGVPPWLQELLHGHWLLYGAWFLLLVGLVLLWSARQTAERWIRHAVAVFRAIDEHVDNLTPRQEMLLHVGLCALFLAPMLWNGPTDDEEGALGFFSAQVYYRDLLLHGRLSYWFNDLGFGTPMPLGQRMDFNPVFGLGSLISLRVAVSAVWILQVGVMAVYFRRLLAAYNVAPGARVVLFGLYLFSLPSFLLFFTTDWVSCLVPWTMYPVLLYYMREAALGGAAQRWWLTTIRLGVILSLWVLNGHPGYLVPLFVSLAAYALVALPPALPVYGAFAAAGVCAVAASAERVYFLVHEMGLFPAGTLRLAQGEYHLQQYLDGLAMPFTGLSDGREAFAGTFVLLAAVAAPVMWRTADRHIRACIVAFFVACGLSLTPVAHVAWTGLSAGWLFRDPMVFFALLAAAAVLQPALGASRTIRRIALVLLAFQGLQQFAVIAPEFRAHWNGNARLEWYRHQGHPPFGVAAAVVRASNQYGKRLYLSPRADQLSRGRMSSAGVHVVTDYALLGLNPVNAWFKNVAMDRIHPSWALMHGMIKGQTAVIDNTTLLDVLGIGVVVSIAEETPAPKNVKWLERVPVGDDVAVDTYGNPDAWPEAVLLSPDARNAALPVVEGCGHTGALCRDYTALAHTRLPQDATLREVDEDGYRVHVPVSGTPRLLFISALYRPEWVAVAGERTLEIEPVADAFIGVTVPPGVQDIELAFRPRTRIALTWVSGVSLVTLLFALGALTWRGRARRSPANPISRGAEAASPGPG